MKREEVVKIDMGKAAKARDSSKKVGKLPSVRKVVAVLSKHGIDADKVAEKLRAGIEATKSVVSDGEIFEVADYPTRYKYVELILKVRGDMKESTEDGAGYKGFFENIVRKADKIEFSRVEEE